MASLKILFYFLVPYVLAWVALWSSLPLVRAYQYLLLKWVKRTIASSPHIGDEDPDGNRVFKWHIFTVKYALIKDPETAQKKIRYLSVKEKLSSPENALHDLDRFFNSFIASLQRFFVELRE